MQLAGFDFGVVDWNRVGSRAFALGDIRLRQVEYAPGYLADHWCEKGHIVVVLEGELVIELRDGRRFVLRPGMSCHVADGREPHRASSTTGARLFIVD